MMRVRFLLAIAAVCFAGCSSTMTFDDPRPGAFSDYREMTYAHLDSVGHVDGAPGQLENEFFSCMTDTTVSFVTPSELQHWNAYARGEIKVTAAEKDAFDDEMKQRIGGPEGLKAAMIKRCPDTMAAIAKYGV